MQDAHSATPNGANNSPFHTVDHRPVDHRPVNYTQFEQEPQFQRLRKRQRSFVFPMAASFLAWYFAFVLLAAYAPEFMATPVFGTINLGLLLGLAQFVTTFAITMWYVRFANAKLDPEAEALREQLAEIEAGTATSTKFETEGADRA